VAARYDRKVAGVIVVVHYPPGRSKDKLGAEQDNADIAQRLLDSIAGGKGIAIPNELASFTDERDPTSGGKTKWIVSLLEDKGGRQAGFGDRLRYLDSLKLRGYLRPERAALEGQFGTKAEAGVHGEIGALDSDLLHADMVRILNWHVVDTLLAINFGEDARGSVYITPAKIADDRAAYYRELLKQVFSGPNGAELFQLWLDTDAMIDLADLPKSQEVVGNDLPTNDHANPVADPTNPNADTVKKIMSLAGLGRKG
jgi:hypothetical protein